LGLVLLNCGRNVDLSGLNTLGLMAQAQGVLCLDNDASLAAVREALHRYGRVRVLGGGSNVVLGQTLDGLIVRVLTRGVRLLAQSGDERIVEARAGENWHGFVQHCLAQGWPGLENLALIPGTVGAAPVQNIGAYGVELAQRFHSLVAWDLRAGREVEMGLDDCRFAYRDSVFKRAAPGRWLIVTVRFRLPVVWRAVLDYPDLQRYFSSQQGKKQTEIQPLDVFDAVCSIRRSKLPDPAVLPNAGSFFKNPVVSKDQYASLKREHPVCPAYTQPDGRYKLAAGWLLEQAGWKGRRVGAVGMHARQALVLVNYGGATADDVLALAAQVRSSVQQRFGVVLEQEPVVFD